jgi:hypothetical protein
MRPHGPGLVITRAGKAAIESREEGATKIFEKAEIKPMLGRKEWIAEAAGRSRRGVVENYTKVELSSPRISPKSIVSSIGPSLLIKWRLLMRGKPEARLIRAPAGYAVTRRPIPTRA